MLRRYEIYTLREGAPPEQVRRLEEAFRRCGEFIPEVNHSIVGSNLSDQAIHMVWEHSYDSPEAYQRYMVHPYHANILDRYLLNDSPERIVTTSPLGDGVLVGYTCETPVYYMKEGVRKVVLFGLVGTLDEQATFIDALRQLADTEEGVVLSVVEPNTMGVAWFDGVTPILPPSQWTHIWELGFESLDAYHAYQRGVAPMARTENEGWTGTGVVSQAVELHYLVNL
jgi:stress responsive alpha/beta barrel protein